MALVGALVAGCAVPSGKQAAGVASTGLSTAAPLASITQLRYADEAEYAWCLEPACPRPTYKTPQSYADLTAQLARRETPGSSRAIAERILVHFAPGSYRLSPAAKKSLKSVIPDARAASGIVLSGRTDDTGTTARNLALSRKRAIAVRDFLTRHLEGATPRFVIDARANCCYIADNASEAGRSSNRRVEVSFDFDMRQATR